MSNVIELELKGQQVVGLVIGGLLFVLTVFLVGMSVGKKMASPPSSFTQNIQQKQLDCVDWLENSIQEKTNR